MKLFLPAVALLGAIFLACSDGSSRFFPQHQSLGEQFTVSMEDAWRYDVLTENPHLRVRFRSIRGDLVGVHRLRAFLSENGQPITEPTHTGFRVSQDGEDLKAGVVFIMELWGFPERSESLTVSLLLLPKPGDEPKTLTFRLPSPHRLESRDARSVPLSSR